MHEVKQPRILPYLGRFTLLHLIAYVLVGLAFIKFQGALPESGRIALDLYEPFRPIELMNIIGQILRGLAFALVLYPFYNVLFKNQRGRLILFGAMWGIALFGSVEPQPGSIEGIIYTTISFTEHLSVLVAVAVQMLLFAWLFFKWELVSQRRKVLSENEAPDSPVYAPEKIRGYVLRFLLVHLITYWVIGSIFYQVAGYADALEEMGIFEMWRPLENIHAVLIVFFGQLFRGTILALLLAPFFGSYVHKKNGWSLLFLLIFGLTTLGSPLFLTEFITFEGSFTVFLNDLIIGIPEIVTQMLVFSFIFFQWQKKRTRENEKATA